MSKRLIDAIAEEYDVRPSTALIMTQIMEKVADIITNENESTKGGDA